MLKLIVPVLVFVAAVSADTEFRSFIKRCSLSDPDLNKCFVRNGNIAIRDLAKGIEDLQIVNLDGFDIGDIFFSLDEDLSFLLENVKSYAKGAKLEKARLSFDQNKVFDGANISYSLTDYYWEGEYRAIGYYNDAKINEKGFFRLNFGPFYGNYTAQLKQKLIDGTYYLKVRSFGGTRTYQQFQFVPSKVTSRGTPLTDEHFESLREPVTNKAVDTRLEYITFVFNQILLEIPRNDIFLP